MKSTKKTAYIVSHTHWDREWRYTIWSTRKWLVDFMDELVELLESGKYAGFLMDGQVSPVLDYLEVRPERTALIRKFIQEGRLQIGPWLTLPDEYPVDAEALVRNLIKGTRAAGNLGGTFVSGYTSFGWGQIAQLPQIYAGFGIDIAFIGKRVNEKRAPHAEFIWRGPDGSELLSTRFGDMGRQNFYFRINLQGLYGLDHQTWDWAYRYQEHGILFHRADREHMEQDFFRIDAPSDPKLDTITPETVEKTWQTTNNSILENDRLMMNGCDYAAAQPLLPEMIERIRNVDPDKDRKWIQATMPEFMDIMRLKIDRSKLPVVHGELRDGPVGYLTGNALATRMDIKQLNRKAQNLLIRQAEPLAAIASFNGHPWPEFFLSKAWLYLLQAHPHDSINGVTQDKTTRDVKYRLEQVIDLAGTITDEAVQAILRQIDLSDYQADDLLLVVFNSLPYARREILETYITMPKDMKNTTIWADDLGFLQVYDPEGNPLDTQWEGVEDADYCVSEVHARILPLYGRRHKLYFDTGEIPAAGYKVFRIGRGKDIRPDTAQWADNQARTGSLLRAPGVMENAFLKVEMNPNGTFNLLDKETKTEYKNLNAYEDRGEHGTYWINYRPMYQQAISSIGCQARIWSEENGPVQSSLFSQIRLALPVRGEKSRQSRGDRTEELVITTKLALRTGERKVDVTVEFENRHEDHYLRAIFPTGIRDINAVHAGGHFYVDARPLAVQGPKEQSEWPDMATQPFTGFVDISNGQKGLAVLTDSLTEYEMLNDDQNTLSLSLLRSVKTWIVSGHVGSDYPSQKGGQVLGHHTLHYALMPHAGDWSQAGVPYTAECFNVPVIPVQTNPHKGSLNGKNATFFRIGDTRLRLSALKKAEDRDTYIVRIFNPEDKALNSTLNFHEKVKQAWKTDLNEERLEELNLSGNNRITIEVESYKIMTLELSFR